jgi:hypothetical protein
MWRWNLMLRFSRVVKLSRRVRSGVDLFASNHAGQNHCQKGDPDHDTSNFKHARLAMSLQLVVGSRARVQTLRHFGNI